MVQRTIRCALFAALVACGSGPEPEAFQAELTEPWAAWGLPVASGRVQFSDDAMLTVTLPPGSDIAAVKAEWSKALTARGFEAKDDTSAGDMVSVTFRNEGESVALGIVGMGDALSLSLTRYAE